MSISFRSQHKEEFLSFMSHSLSVIPVSGYESRFPLTSRSKKTHKGFIHLFLSIQADTDKQLEVFEQFIYSIIRFFHIADIIQSCRTVVQFYAHSMHVLH